MFLKIIQFFHLKSKNQCGSYVLRLKGSSRCVGEVIGSWGPEIAVEKSAPCTTPARMVARTSASSFLLWLFAMFVPESASLFWKADLVSAAADLWLLYLAGLLPCAQLCAEKSVKLSAIGFFCPAGMCHYCFCLAIIYGTVLKTCQPDGRSELPAAPCSQRALAT